ncbi:MAG: THUMP domain-containing protein [Candidatus Bathyarchaeia archaeon]|nr:THUMP domain-containing protein [Candidatus Bathyarchaeota archaeon]
MLERFNLVVSTSRRNERNASREVWYLLNEAGDKNPEVSLTPVVGLIVALTSLNPLDALSRLREIMRERPWEFRYILKITPVERLVRADLSEIGILSQELAGRIGPEESYRVTVRKRHSDISSRDIIDVVASKIGRRVDLENPDKIVLVEVISNFAGLSVITPEDILSVAKEKNNLKR